MIIRLLITLAVFGLLAGAVFLYKQDQAESRSARMAGGPPPAVVTETKAQLKNWASRIEAVGDLKAVQQVAVASEVPGKVVDIAFASGATVASGDVLVRLDASDDQAQLKSLKAELDLARLEYQRVRKLRGSAAFSQSLLDRTQSLLDSLVAQVDRQTVMVRRKTLRAPFDGVLGIRLVSQGKIVAPGDAIVELQSIAPIYVDFTVPERHRGQLQTGQALETAVAAWPDDRFPGQLTVISPAVDIRSRTLAMRGELQNKDKRLQPGMFATVHLLLGEPTPVLTLPRTAISFFAYGESVFSINEADGRLTVSRQPVKVGRTRDGLVEVLDGLEPGQRVVHTGHSKLRDGQAIKTSAGITLPRDLEDG